MIPSSSKVNFFLSFNVLKSYTLFNSVLFLNTTMFVSKSFSLLSTIPDIPFDSTYISGFILSTIFSISESLDNIILESY